MGNKTNIKTRLELMVMVAFVATSLMGLTTNHPFIYRGLFILAIFNCLLKQSRGFNLLSIIPIATIGQLILAPSELRDSMNGFFIYGPLDFSEYQSFAMPLIFSGLLPFFLCRNHKPVKENTPSLVKENTKIMIKFLVVFGFLSRIFFWLWGNVSIVGALLFYAQLSWKIATILVLFHSKNRLWFFVLASLLIFDSYTSTLWWDVGVFAIIGLIYGYSLGRFGIVKLIQFAAVGVLIVVFIQSAKHFQRSGGNLTRASIDMIIDDLSSANDDGLLFEGLLGRLNQGVHDSFVYNNAALKTTKEMTIPQSFLGVFVPRIIYPDKPSFNSKKLRMLGNYDGMGSAFITLSGFAEAYANFGLFGGMIFLFIFSLWLNHLWRMLRGRLDGPALLLLIIPFFHVLRCEVDFYHWFSGLFNGWLVFELITRVLKNNSYPRGYDEGTF